MTLASCSSAHLLYSIDEIETVVVSLLKINGVRYSKTEGTGGIRDGNQFEYFYYTSFTSFTSSTVSISSCRIIWITFHLLRLFKILTENQPVNFSEIFLNTLRFKSN